MAEKKRAPNLSSARRRAAFGAVAAARNILHSGALARRSEAHWARDNDNTVPETPEVVAAARLSVAHDLERESESLLRACMATVTSDHRHNILVDDTRFRPNFDTSDDSEEEDEERSEPEKQGTFQRDAPSRHHHHQRREEQRAQLTAMDIYEWMLLQFMARAAQLTLSAGSSNKAFSSREGNSTRARGRGGSGSGGGGAGSRERNRSDKLDSGSRGSSNVEAQHMIFALLASNEQRRRSFVLSNLITETVPRDDSQTRSLLSASRPLQISDDDTDEYPVQDTATDLTLNAHARAQELTRTPLDVLPYVAEHDSKRVKALPVRPVADRHLLRKIHMKFAHEKRYATLSDVDALRSLYDALVEKADMEDATPHNKKQAAGSLTTLVHTPELVSTRADRDLLHDVCANGRHIHLQMLLVLTANCTFNRHIVSAQSDVFVCRGESAHTYVHGARARRAGPEYPKLAWVVVDSTCRETADPVHYLLPKDMVLRDLLSHRKHMTEHASNMRAHREACLRLLKMCGAMWWREAHLAHLIGEYMLLDAELVIPTRYCVPPYSAADAYELAAADMR